MRYSASEKIEIIHTFKVKLKLKYIYSVFEWVKHVGAIKLTNGNTMRQNSITHFMQQKRAGFLS